MADGPDPAAVSDPAAASLEPATERYRRHVGTAATERPAPDLPRALGGVLALLAVIALVGLLGEVVEGDTSRGVGFVAFALYGFGGLFVVVRGHASQRTAGVVALAASVPAALGFVILGDDQFSSSEPTTVLALSTVAWGFLHLTGPARGHGTLLAATLVGAWFTIIVQTGLDALLAFDPFVGAGPDPLGIDMTTPALVSILFGTGYLVAGYALDRAGLRGTATSFLGAGIGITAVGVVLAGSGRDPLLGAALMTAAGLLVAFVGARLARRLSTWVGAAGAALGVAVFVDSLFEDSTEAGAVAFLIVAAATIAALPGLGAALGQGPDGVARPPAEPPAGA